MYNALMKRKLGKKGFTLIELIVVIAIIAILAVILIPRFTGFTDNANMKSAISDTRNILLVVQALQADGVVVSATGADALEQVNNYIKGSNTTATDQYSGTLDTTDVAAGNFSFEVVKGTKTFRIYVRDYQLITDTAAATYAPAIIS